MAKGGGRGEEEEEEEIDHYSILGLPSGEEGSKLTQKEILRAYREQSRVRHPDKRPDDPGATADFQRLKSSFEALKDDSRRARLDARLRAQREKLVRDSLQGAKRRRFATDLEERERAAAEQEEAERKVGSAERGAKAAAAELKKELDDFRARKANKGADPAAPSALFWLLILPKKKQPQNRPGFSSYLEKAAIAKQLLSCFSREKKQQQP